MRIELRHGDCLDVLRTLPDCSVDAVVTDPPYGLAFMGKKWDYDVPSVEVWAECLRVLKPGGHLLAFAGTRTQHRMAVRIEDAGFEIRDMIAWVYSTGFPKSLDVSKAIDKAAGAQREVVASRRLTGTARIKGQAAYGATSGRSEEAYQDGSEINDTLQITAPATPEAQQWSGWGTALKPALEPITVARKPLAGTVAANVLEHGTGAINVDGCRVGGEPWKAHSPTGLGSVKFFTEGETPVIEKAPHDAGRWPANLIHDGSDEVVGLFPQSSSGANPTRRGGMGYHGAEGQESCDAPRGAESGSAARFFYCAKASKRDRDEGLDAFAIRSAGEVTGGREDGSAGLQSPRAGAGRTNGARNVHPTVKPTDLMRYLCRLVTPPGGVVLDPFMGSGSTGKGAVLEGFRFIGIEREAEYMEIARARIEAMTTTDTPAEAEAPHDADQLPLF
jgi:site-specific DNA-methyltransferase (adenine-specific)